MSESKELIKITEKEAGSIIAELCRVRIDSMLEVLGEDEVDYIPRNASTYICFYNLHLIEKSISNAYDERTSNIVITYAMEELWGAENILNVRNSYRAVSKEIEKGLTLPLNQEVLTGITRTFLSAICEDSSQYYYDAIILFHISMEITSWLTGIGVIVDNYKIVNNTSAPASNSNKQGTKIKPLLITLVIALIISIALNIIYVPTSLTYEKTMADYKLKIDKLRESRSNIVGERESLKSYESELDWYMSNAVLVTDEGSCYHKSCCQYVDGKSFYIYNVENARAQGYRKCKVCFGDDYDWRDYI